MREAGLFPRAWLWEFPFMSLSCQLIKNSLGFSTSINFNFQSLFSGENLSHIKKAKMLNMSSSTVNCIHNIKPDTFSFPTHLITLVNNGKFILHKVRKNTPLPAYRCILTQEQKLPCTSLYFQANP